VTLRLTSVVGEATEDTVTTLADSEESKENSREWTKDPTRGGRYALPHSSRRRIGANEQGPGHSLAYDKVLNLSTALLNSPVLLPSSFQSRTAAAGPLCRPFY
jgi:hypothetical protein